MSVEIIPAINAETFEEVREKIRKVEPYVSWVHVDVADGSFTDVTLWHNPKDLLLLQTPLFVEVHLMIANIDEQVEEWLEPVVRRVIFHREASENPDSVIEACRKSDTQVGMSIRPDSPAELLIPYASKVDVLQTLAVVPGRSGQTFQPETLQKINALHRACSSCAIEVDGGVNNSTARSIASRGATLLVAGAALFQSRNIKQAIEELRRHATT